MKHTLIARWILSILTVFSVLSLSAQNPYRFLDGDKERAAGHYHHYEVPDSSLVSRPEGYVPFYISHYGRHGCRWHTSSLVYERPLVEMREMKEAGVLTEEGEKLFEALNFIAEDARGKEGNLTPRGEREHRGIAERMIRTYPEIFRGEAQIDCRSTDVPRCILSMCAFTERLKELNPSLSVSRTSYARDLYYMINRVGAKSVAKRAAATCDSLQKAWLRPEPFLNRIVADQEYIRTRIARPEKLMYHIYQIASILQDTDYLGLSLFDYFTEEELDDLWRCENAYVYLTQGPSLEYGEGIIEDAKPLLWNIIETADEVISGRSEISASLRFGHDQALVPLYALMGIEGACRRVRADQAEVVWNVSKVTPMGTNLQFIFFRKEHGGESDEIKVRVLHNEKDAVLPIEGYPFYDWKILREYLVEKAEGL